MPALLKLNLWNLKNLRREGLSKNLNHDYFFIFIEDLLIYNYGRFIMETQRIMVTGGSGFIGTNLCNELRRRGHEVLSVDLLHHEDEADLYSDSYADYVPS